MDSIFSIFSVEYTIWVIYGLSPSCFATHTASPCYPAQVVYSSKFSDGKSVYTGEPFPYQFEPQPSCEGDDIPVDIPNEVRMYQTGNLQAVWTVSWEMLIGKIVLL